MYHMKKELEKQTKLRKRIVFNFYCYWHQNYIKPEPVILEADNLEKAIELFHKDYSDESIYKITFQKRALAGFGWGQSPNELDFVL